jgi:Uma2 family endonuclease
VDCRTSDDTVRRPDVLIFRGSAWLLVDPDRIPLPFAPDIAVEILSRSEKAVEVNSKFAEYLAAGSAEVWLIDPKNIEVLARSTARARMFGAGETLESPLLPGFSFGVSATLAGPEL